MGVRTHWSEETTRWAALLQHQWLALENWICRNINNINISCDDVLPGVACPGVCPMCCDHGCALLTVITMGALSSVLAPPHPHPQLLTQWRDDSLVTSGRGGWSPANQRPGSTPVTNERARQEMKCHPSSSDQHNIWNNSWPVLEELCSVTRKTNISLFISTVGAVSPPQLSGPCYLYDLTTQ